MDQIRGERKAVDFGSQIRSYVLAPYQMVKDHRTDVEVGDPQRVLDGDLDRLHRGGASPAGRGVELASRPRAAARHSASAR